MFAKSLLLVLGLAFTTVFGVNPPTRYQPTWESLDKRPIPEWYDDAKVGIFIHFGVYSVPSFASEWFWNYWKTPSSSPHKEVADFMEQNYPPNFTYQDFARELTLEFFNATEWIEIFEKAGAKYAVLTSKHHEGYTMWPSKHSFSWNAMDVGPMRDIVGEFAAAIRHSGKMHLGLYHSLFEWFNPLYHEDSKNNFTTRFFAGGKSMPELFEIVNTYKPDLIWSDGDAGPVEYWQSREFLAWLYNDSPVKDQVVTNDRWGDGTSCHHGGYFNCADRYTPSGKQHHKWENCMTLDMSSWGYRRNAKLSEIMTMEHLITQLIQTVSNGGNILIDVGPKKEGTIPLIQQDRLQQLGSWLSVNGPAIYETRSWSRTWNDTLTKDVYYTTSKDGTVVNAMFLNWPKSGNMTLGSVQVQEIGKVTLLGYDKPLLTWSKSSNGSATVIKLPDYGQVSTQRYAWSLQISMKSHSNRNAHPKVIRVL